MHHQGGGLWSCLRQWPRAQPDASRGAPDDGGENDKWPRVRRPGAAAGHGNGSTVIAGGASIIGVLSSSDALDGVVELLGRTSQNSDRVSAGAPVEHGVPRSHLLLGGRVERNHVLGQELKPLNQFLPQFRQSSPPSGTRAVHLSQAASADPSPSRAASLPSLSNRTTTPPQVGPLTSLSRCEQHSGPRTKHPPRTAWVGSLPQRVFGDGRQGHRLQITPPQSRGVWALQRGPHRGWCGSVGPSIELITLPHPTFETSRVPFTNPFGPASSSGCAWPCARCVPTQAGPTKRSGAPAATASRPMRSIRSTADR